ncbi:phage GP46 family protein [Acidisoma sp. 7E03]
MLAPMWCDIGLKVDPITGKFDVALANGDVVLDRTPATPLLISLLTDRRAEPGDVLPVSPPPGGPIFNARRGWVGDALDRKGDRIGSRLWLLSRAKQTEDTRLLALSYATQATGWIKAKVAAAGADDLTISARWVRKGVLGLVFKVGKITLNVPVRTT